VISDEFTSHGRVASSGITGACGGGMKFEYGGGIGTKGFSDYVEPTVGTAIYTSAANLM